MKPKTITLSSLDNRILKPALILLAEDNELNRMAYAKYLDTKGYLVAEAGNGLEAIEKARLLKPGLVLMDIQMPGMNGLDAIQRLRADPDPVVAHLPIIALTAQAMPGDRERCLTAGANDYLSKPVGLSDLLSKIQDWLQRLPNQLVVCQSDLDRFNP